MFIIYLVSITNKPMYIEKKVYTHCIESKTDLKFVLSV